MIVHHQSVHNKFPGYTESVDRVAYLSGIYNAREAQWSPGDSDGHASHSVVNDFVTAQQVQRVGAVVALDG